jgi:nucleoid-associated protein YgaU
MLTRDPVVGLCLAALAVAAGWVCLVASCLAAELWRARSEGRRARVRQVLLACCGAALVVPAGQAAADDGLAGLPIPDRAVGPAHPHRAAPPRSVVVAVGDCLWTLAAADLPSGAGAAEVTSRWHAIYRLNRGVIGADPDLIRPGQVLLLPAPRTSRSTP